MPQEHHDKLKSLEQLSDAAFRQEIDKLRREDYDGFNYPKFANDLMIQIALRTFTNVCAVRVFQNLAL